MYKVKQQKSAFQAVTKMIPHILKMTLLSGCSLSCPCLSGCLPPPGSLQGGEGDSQALRLPVRCCRWLLQGKLPENWKPGLKCEYLVCKHISSSIISSILTYREMWRVNLWLLSLMAESRPPLTLLTMSRDSLLMLAPRGSQSTLRQGPTSPPTKRIHVATLN